jgi:hypothetical protein
MTTKDILLEMRDDVKQVRLDVAVLVSQELNKRLDNVETWKDQLTGKIIVVSAVIALAINLLGPAFWSWATTAATKP